MKKQEYRFLRKGEIIKEGDEIFMIGKWRESNLCGEKVKDGDYRRPIKLKSARRPSKHERLLKALLKCVGIYSHGYVSQPKSSEEQWNRLNERDAKQLIAIKERMEKGAKG
jgi:hypothetical protein